MHGGEQPSSHHHEVGEKKKEESEAESREEEFFSREKIQLKGVILGKRSKRMVEKVWKRSL